MVLEWYEETKDRKDQVSVYAFPRGRGIKVKYDLRNTPGRGPRLLVCRPEAL